MEHTDIRKLAELMRDMELTVLEITEKDFSVRLERSGPSSAPSLSRADAAEELPSGPEAGIYTVTSPMIGVFYASPSPDGKPYVSVGDTVRAGQVLCVVEAMKIMNEIISEAAAW
jgi:acetyl-CoA carboxylase biotin carboxyl carrier protein